MEKAKEYCKKHKMKFKFVCTERDQELYGENEMYCYDVFGTNEQIEQFKYDNDVMDN